VVTMDGESRRGPALTVFAVLFALLAIEDILKPFGKHDLELPGMNLKIGLMFFGTRLSGAAEVIIAPLLGIFLLTYAAGILRMRRYALYFAYGYAVYVVLNVLLAWLKNPAPITSAEIAFAVVYYVLAVSLTWSAALVLRAHRATLT
jgi:hypothetical protein